MERVFAYVDETGDRGLHPRSSPYFTFAAVLVREANANMVQTFKQDLQGAIARQVGQKVKWTDLGHLERVVSATRLSQLPIRLIYVCIPKVNVMRSSGLTESALFYNFAAKLMLERISWFGDRKQAVVDIWFEKVRGFDPTDMLKYFELLRGLQTSIQWQNLGKIRVDSPANIAGLGAADHAAGAFDAATRRDPATSLVEERYLQILKPKIYRGKTNKPLVYGFKVLGDLGDIEHLGWWPLFGN